MTTKKASSRRDSTLLSPSGLSVASTESGEFLSMSETGMLLSMMDGQSLLSSGDSDSDSDEEETTQSPTPIEPSTGNDSLVSLGEKSNDSNELRQSKKDVMRALLAEYGLDGDLSVESESNSYESSTKDSDTENDSNNGRDSNSNRNSYGTGIQKSTTNNPQDSGSVFEIASDDENEPSPLIPLKPTSARKSPQTLQSSNSVHKLEDAKSPTSVTSEEHSKSIQESPRDSEFLSDESDDDHDHHQPMTMVPLAPISFRQTPQKLSNPISSKKESSIPPRHSPRQSPSNLEQNVLEMDDREELAHTKPVSTRSAYQTDPFASPVSTESSEFQIEKLTSQMQLVEAFMDGSPSIDEIDDDDQSILSQENYQHPVPDTAKRKTTTGDKLDDGHSPKLEIIDGDSSVSLSSEDGLMDKNYARVAVPRKSNDRKSSGTLAMDKSSIQKPSNGNAKGNGEKPATSSAGWKVKVPARKQSLIVTAPKRNPSKDRKRKKKKALSSQVNKNEVVLPSRMEQPEVNDDSSVESPLQGTSFDESLKDTIDYIDAPEASDSDTSNDPPIMLIKPQNFVKPVEAKTSSRNKSAVTQETGVHPTSNSRTGNSASSERTKSITQDDESDSESSDEMAILLIKPKNTVTSPEQKKEANLSKKESTKKNKGANKVQNDEQYPHRVATNPLFDENIGRPSLKDGSKSAADATKRKKTGSKEKKKTKSKSKSKSNTTRSKAKPDIHTSKAQAKPLPPYQFTYERSNEPSTYATKNGSMRSIDSDGIWRPPKQIPALDASVGDFVSLDGSRGSLGSADMNLTSVEWNGLDAPFLRTEHDLVDRGRRPVRPLTPDSTTQMENDRGVSPAIESKFSAVQLQSLTLSGNRSETSSNDYATTPKEKRGIGRFIRWPRGTKKELTRGPSTSSFDGGSVRSRSTIGTDDMELAKTPKAAKSTTFPWPTIPRFPSSSSLDKIIDELDTECNVHRKNVDFVNSPSRLVIARSLPESHPSLESPGLHITQLKDTTPLMTPTPKKPKSNSWLPWAKKSPKDILPPIHLEPKSTPLSEAKSKVISSRAETRPLTSPPLVSSSGQRRTSGHVSQSVSEQREARRKQYMLDQQRREAIRIQAVMRGYMSRKRYYVPKRQAKLSSKVSQEQRTIEVKKPPDQEIGMAINRGVSKVSNSAKKGVLPTDKEEAMDPVSIQSKPTTSTGRPLLPPRDRRENPGPPKSVSQQREERRQAYLLDQQRRGSIVIQSALRGFIVRKKLGLDRPKSKSHSAEERAVENRKAQQTPALSEESRTAVLPRERVDSRRLTVNRNKPMTTPTTPDPTTPKKSMKWLPWAKKKDSTTLDSSLDAKSQTNDGTNIQRFDASIYLRKRMYQDEQENQGKTLAEIKEARREMYLRDLERREVIKIQSTVRGFLTRTKLFPKAKKKKVGKVEKNKPTKHSNWQEEGDRNNSVKHPGPSSVVVDSFDRSSYLRERLQRDEEKRQMKTVAEVREERQQIYLRDLQRREATKIQAAIRGFVTRRKYPGMARTHRQVNTQAHPTPATGKTDVAPSSSTTDHVDNDNTKSSGNWGLVKRLFFGKSKETPISKDPVEENEIQANEQQYEPFDPYADTDDFFGFEEPKYKERNGFFSLEKSERNNVEVQAVSEDARNWKGRKKRAPSVDLDKAAYLKERKAREEFERRSTTIAKQNAVKIAAARSDLERRGAVIIQAFARGYISRRRHPPPKKRTKDYDKKKEQPTHKSTTAQSNEEGPKSHEAKSLGRHQEQRTEGRSKVQDRRKKAQLGEMPAKTKTPLLKHRTEAPGAKHGEAKTNPKDSSQRILVAAKRKSTRSDVQNVPAMEKQMSNGVSLRKVGTTNIADKVTASNNAPQGNLRKISSNQVASAMPTQSQRNGVQDTIERTIEFNNKEKDTVLKDDDFGDEYIEEVIEEDEYFEEVVIPVVPPSNLTHTNRNSSMKDVAVKQPSLGEVNERDKLVVQSAPKRMGPMVLVDAEHEARKHSGSTYSTDVGDSWWLPSVDVEDTRPYRQEVYVPDTNYNQYYMRPAPKTSTTTYWEAVRASYLPSVLDGNGIHEPSTLVPPVARFSNERGISMSSKPKETSSMAKVDSWLPPDSASCSSTSIPHGGADALEEKESSESWVPVPIKSQLRVQRVDFTGAVYKEESFRWAPHLPSPSKRDKSRIERLVVGDLREALSEGDVEETRDVEQGTPDVIMKETKSPCCTKHRRVILLFLLVLILLGVGVCAAYFFWEDPPWEKWLD